MNFFCIADKDSSPGFKLMGLEVREASTKPEALEALSVALATPDTGIIIVTDKLSGFLREKIDEYIYKHENPLILEVPSRTSLGSGKSISEFVKEAIGIKI
jgi:vacuolar-type H+-ATPase subunit F/Vma7